MSRDLVNPRWMYLKAILFCVTLVVASTVLFLQSMSFTTVAMIMLVMWASARLYYFMFYVIERYIDPSFKFAGIWAVVRHVMSRKSAGRSA